MDSATIFVLVMAAGFFLFVAYLALLSRKSRAADAARNREKDEKVS